MAEPALTAGRTKQGLVADALSSDIRAGKYSVGDLLPSEPQLSQRFGVSRHTVRAALRSLQQVGLVSSQQGVGTLVQGTHVQSRYSHSFDTAEDLLQYAASTPVRTLGRDEVEIDAARAAHFGCKPGEHWWRLRTLRTNPSRRTVVGYSEIFLPLAFGAVLDEASRSKQPVFALIESRFQETIVEIQQDVACVPRLSAQECSHLKLPPRSPGLEINRRYVGRNGRVLEVTRSVHPPEVFRYSMRMQLRHGISS
jgi:GntR family transcriptional regulator